MTPAPRRVCGLLLASAALVSCGDSNVLRQIARNSNFSTFSSVTGTVNTRWPDGAIDNSAVELDKDEGVGVGICEVSLHGDVIGRVGHPALFSGQPSRIIIECERDGAQLWHLIGATDNLTLAKAGDMLSLREPRTGGPTTGCSDTTMPVDVSVSVTDAVSTVDPSTINVGADFLRRQRIAGRVGQTACGVAEMNLDVVAEIRPDAFNFTEQPISGSE